MIDYIIRFIVAVIFAVIFIISLNPIVEGVLPDFGDEIELLIGIVFLITSLIIGWLVAGKVIRSSYYTPFLEEVIATPNNPQITNILTFSLISAVVTFTIGFLMYSLGFTLAGDILKSVWIGSLIYSVIALKMWFFGGMLGVNSPFYNDTKRLYLSRFWAFVSPFVFTYWVQFDVYEPIVIQVFAMMLIRFIYFIRNSKSAY